MRSICQKGHPWGRRAVRLPRVKISIAAAFPALVIAVALQTGVLSYCAWMAGAAGGAAVVDTGAVFVDARLWMR
ncbi:MAG: hypothetical protein D6755_05080 [Anaerolineae bacterium]|nr:MAG: hypothetical protein D6755_05080 [Anaerolineae bacterium]